MPASLSSRMPPAPGAWRGAAENVRIRNSGQLAIASTIRSFPKEKTIVERERSKGIYDVGPYFLSKVVAEAPLTTALSALGGVLLYPLVGLQGGMLSQKFANFLAILSLEGLASGGLGLLLGAAAPSSDARVLQ